MSTENERCEWRLDAATLGYQVTFEPRKMDLGYPPGDRRRYKSAYISIERGANGAQGRLHVHSKAAALAVAAALIEAAAMLPETASTDVRR